MRRAGGPVAPKRRAVADPAAMADEIRAQATDSAPDALIGFCRFSQDVVYEGESVTYANAISLGLPMDRGPMSQAPQPPAGTEVLRGYRLVGKLAVELAEHIRALGWPAKAYLDTKATEFLHIPLAVEAGLGELGKHGSLISRRHGSNLRLATVLTDLPLEAGRPVDLGVDDLCARCRRCTADCPPGAIFETKQLVRGVRKWYVDFDKCVPYFAETGGCAICIQVCPWSEPGRGPALSAKLLAKRGARIEGRSA